MTKSRTLRKAGAVVLSLAMAFSVAGVAPSADAAAKKPALSAKKGTITVGKKKAVKIKNTTKKKVKKLVVSSNKTAVATVKKNNKVKFTVTGKKAGTAKITAKVTLKKAVAKKKVYKLKYTATVKEAATPTTAPDVTAAPEELKLDSVEGAQRSNAGSTNVIVAYFSAAVADFAATDVEIRRVSDNRLYTVEKVVPSSDKKTATLSLTGTSSAGTAGTTEFLQDNVEYKLIVKAGGKTYEKVFVIPMVLAEVVVSGVDSKNKKLTIDGASTYEVADGVTVDYFDILGKTVTAEVDINGKIVKLNEVALTTVISAFSYTKGDAAKKTTAVYKDVVSGTEYTTTAGSAVNAKTYPTQTVKYNDGFAAAGIGINGNGIAADNPGVPATNLAWGKLVLNPDKTIRTIQGIATSSATGNFTAQSAYVTAADAGVITNGASAKINVKDFAIVKDGKLIDTTTVAAGDVLFYDSSKKVGYIYNNATKGVFTKDYTSSYVFADKEYKHAVTDIKDAKESALTTSGVSDLITAKTELSLYTNLGGFGAYAIGEAAALTSTVNLFVTSSGTSGNGDAAAASATGYNPATKAMETYSWTGTSLIALDKVDGWNVTDHTAQVPTLVKFTVAASDGKTVKKIEPQTAQISAGTAWLDKKNSAGDTTTVDKITKSVKLIGTTNANGMSTSAAKVVVYKNPSAATTAWAATNFTTYDFASWTGYIDDSADVANGKFGGTYAYGTLSKNLDFVFANGAVQTNAGSTGVENGDSFLAFATGVSSGTSKRLEVLAKQGDASYETFNSDAGKVNLAGIDKNSFVQITLSKNYATDKTVSEVKGAIASTKHESAFVGSALASANCNGSVLNVVDKGAFNIESDCLVIKATKKNDTYSYALSEPTAINAGASVSVLTRAGSSSKATGIVFEDPDEVAKANVATYQNKKAKWASANYSAESATAHTPKVTTEASLTTRLQSADDGIYTDIISKVKYAAAKADDKSVKVTAYFTDGTESEVTITTAALTGAIIGSTAAIGDIDKFEDDKTSAKAFDLSATKANFDAIKTQITGLTNSGTTLKSAIVKSKTDSSATVTVTFKDETTMDLAYTDVTNTAGKNVGEDLLSV